MKKHLFRLPLPTWSEEKWFYLHITIIRVFSLSSPRQKSIIMLIRCEVSRRAYFFREHIFERFLFGGGSLMSLGSFKIISADIATWSIRDLTSISMLIVKAFRIYYLRPRTVGSPESAWRIRVPAPPAFSAPRTAAAPCAPRPSASGSNEPAWNIRKVRRET